MKNVVVVLGLAFCIYGCTNTGNHESVVNALSERSVPKKELSLEVEADCWAYIKGKSFYSQKARIDFYLDGNAYVYSLSDNTPVFTGYVTTDDFNTGKTRIFRLHDTLGSSQMILLSLTSQGELIDLSDYTIYQIH